MKSIIKISIFLILCLAFATITSAKLNRSKKATSDPRDLCKSKANKLKCNLTCLRAATNGICLIPCKWSDDTKTCS